MTAFTVGLLTLAGLLFVASPAAAEEESGPQNDYGRAQINGSQGNIRWESLLHGDELQGWKIEDSPWTPAAWSREGDTIIADVGDENRARIVRGDDSWRYYEVKVQATLVKGSALQIHFSISEDGSDSYHLAILTGWKAVAIIKQDHTKIDVANFVFEQGREYDIVVAVRGNSVISYIDGELVNRVTLPEPPRGGIGLAVWGRGTVARFREPKIRHYFKEHDHE